MSNHLPPLFPGSEAASVADGIATVIRAKDEEIVALSKRVTTAEAEVARLTPWVSKLQASVISVTARAERIEKAARAVISADKEFRLTVPNDYGDPLTDAIDALQEALPEAPASAKATDAEFILTPEMARRLWDDLVGREAADEAARGARRAVDQAMSAIFGKEPLIVERGENAL